MKLFGGKSEGGHVDRPGSAAPAQKKSSSPQTGEAEGGFAAVLAFIRRGGLRRFRVPLLISGCVLLVALAALVAHAVFVRAPKTEEGGLNELPAVRPAVTENVIATPPPETLPTDAPPAETEQPAETEPPNVRKEDCYTFVLMAKDQVSGNTDTVLVGRLDAKEGTLNFANIPRDTLVNVSWSVKKLNTLMNYERGDMDRVKQHLAGLLGFTVDSYAVVDIKVVERLVDEIGGISYNIPRDMDYDDPDQDLHIHFAQGSQWLSGADVVKVLRFREGNEGTGYPNGDLGRIKTQQDLLKTAATQFLSLQNIPHLNEIINIFVENVNTDMTAGNLLYYAEAFLKMDRDNIRFHTAPGEAVAIRSGSYYQIEPDGWVKIINEALNPWTMPVEKDRNLDILQKLGKEGAISTSGELVPLSSFY